MWWKLALNQYLVPPFAQTDLHPPTLGSHAKTEAEMLASETLECKIEKERQKRNGILSNYGMSQLEGEQGYELIRGIPQSQVHESYPNSLSRPGTG